MKAISIVTATIVASSSFASVCEVASATTSEAVAPVVQRDKGVKVSFAATQALRSRLGQARAGNSGYFMQDKGPSWVNSPRGLPQINQNYRSYQQRGDAGAQPSVSAAFDEATSNLAS
jgi:hypothetical protein